MEYTRVTRKQKDYRSVVELMLTAFPPEERIPTWILYLLSRKKNVNFYAWYENQEFCGITYTLESETMIFLLYFAVNAQQRSKGYGSRIIHELKQAAGGREIILNVEKPDQATENNAQRVQRIAFYERNGFYQSDFDLRIEKTDYLVFSTSAVPDKTEFSNILKKYHIGQIQATGGVEKILYCCNQDGLFEVDVKKR